MKSKVLIIGGSYFLGRMTVNQFKDSPYELFVVNRGNFPLNKPFVKELRVDRKDKSTMGDLIKEVGPDVIIDFCAYQPGDIGDILKTSGINQYIYISTANVLDFDDNYNVINKKDDYGDDRVKEYVINKGKLEEELKELSNEKSFAYTILRPVSIYGPFNYANREGYYFKKFLNKEPIIFPKDSDSKFSFVYVMDAASIIYKSVLNRKTYGKTFLLSNSEEINWEKIELVMKKLFKGNGNYLYYSSNYILENKIPLPYAINHDEFYKSDELLNLLNIEPISFEDGLSETFKIFMSVNKNRG